MQKITAKEKSIRDLLTNQKYYIDFYQREYKWQEKQLQELINDLTEVFDENYEENDSRVNIQSYEKYFLGSIIIYEKDGKRYIIDGQQRLTTITLILIYLRNIIEDDAQKSKLFNLIFSDIYGIKSYNINVEERKIYFDELINGKIPEFNNFDESIENIILVYRKIDEFFPEDYNDKKFLYFSDWLIENVYMVEITTQSEDDAYFIFETMNDRGLSLTSVEMLKGYLLSQIKENEKRNIAAKIWKDQIERLRSIGKDEDSEFFKSWLRAKYAKSIREKTKGSIPQDFDKIGTELHRWFKENEDLIIKQEENKYYDFINKNIKFYSERFIELKEYSQNRRNGLDSIYYLNVFGFTLQYPLLLAAININDKEEIIYKKYQLVGTFLDIILVRRLWNYKGVDYKNMQHIVFNTIKEIRNKDLSDLVKILYSKLKEDKLGFLSKDDFKLMFTKKFYFKYILARITEYIEINSGMPSRFDEYMAEGSNRYEIEHILSNNAFNELKEEFSNINEFNDYRNRIGCLLLLPKKFNSSLGAKSFKEKLEHYFGQNLLAKSLHENCYKNNPGFLKFIKENNLPFKPYSKFGKKEIEERQELYSILAEKIWSPDIFKSYK